MPQPEVRRRVRRGLRAAFDLTLLEIRVITGNRGLVLALVEVAWFVGVAVMSHFQDEPWNPVSFYNSMLVVPGMLPAVALAMAAVMGEREARHLEVTFASPGGRYQVWSFRLAAIACVLLVTTLGMALATWVFLARELSPLPAALHATVPLVFVASLTVCLSVLFNGGAAAALVSSALVGVSAVLFHGSRARYDLFLNPFDPPQDLLDPHAWFRTIVFNRSLLLVMSGLAIAVALSALQSRERLV